MQVGGGGEKLVGEVNDGLDDGASCAVTGELGKFTRKKIFQAPKNVFFVCGP